MLTNDSPALVLAGACTLIAALAHLACVAGGPAWYRAMGAGPRMVRAAEQRHWKAPVITLGIAAVLTLWAAHAWSAASLLPKLPLQAVALPTIASVFLARGLLFPLLKRHFPGNSTAFWYWSSGICLALGLLYLVGLWQAWSRPGVA